MDGYEKRAIPRPGPTQPVTVEVDYTLFQIESVVRAQILHFHMAKSLG